MTSRSQLVLAVCVGLVIGTAAGYAWVQMERDSLRAAFSASLTPIQETNSLYKFVRPLLAYRTPEATKYGELVDLKAALEQDVANVNQSPGVSRIAFYFRDLNTARWVGINQDDTYHPASLLKVPLMIAYFKEAESASSILTESAVYHTFTNLPPFEAPSELVVGKSYTIKELLDSMIIDSDNGATFTLLDYINPEILSATYSALGIPEPGDGSTDYQISARTYGLFFRILYNATYLSPASSEKALELLSKVDFIGGLRAGVPKDMVMAQKYGEHVLSDGKTSTGVELSDCGVVYYPGHPYLLCVMTSAKDETTASTAISTISKTTYDVIEKKYPVQK